MRSRAALILITLLIGSLGARAQQPGEKPAFDRAPDALERVSWRTRTVVNDDRLTGWKFALPANGVGVTTFLDAIVRADAAGVNFVEGSSGQTVSGDVAKNLDPGLTAAEIASVRARMGNMRMLDLSRRDAGRCGGAAKAVRVRQSDGGGHDRHSRGLGTERRRHACGRIRCQGGAARAGRRAGPPDERPRGPQQAPWRRHRHGRVGAGRRLRARRAREREGPAAATSTSAIDRIADRPRATCCSARVPGTSVEFFHELNRLNVEAARDDARHHRRRQRAR